jgi:hypothetical protein
MRTSPLSPPVWRMVTLAPSASASLQQFKSPGYFFTPHAVYDTFHAQRHLVSAPTYRVLRADTLATWRTAVAPA